MLGKNNPMADSNFSVYLKIYKKLLKTFRNYSSQDLHPMVEDNLHAWLQILKDTLALKIEGLTGSA